MVGGGGGRGNGGVSPVTAFVGVQDANTKWIFVVLNQDDQWVLPGDNLKWNEIDDPWDGASRALKDKSGYVIPLSDKYEIYQHGGCHLFKREFDFSRSDRHVQFSNRTSGDQSRDFGFYHLNGNRYEVTAYSGKVKPVQNFSKETLEHLQRLLAVKVVVAVGVKDVTTETIFVVLNDLYKTDWNFDNLDQIDQFGRKSRDFGFYHIKDNRRGVTSYGGKKKNVQTLSEETLQHLLILFPAPN